MADVPKLISPEWSAIAEPLLKYLTVKPRAIEDVLKWARKYRMVADLARSALAWLSLSGKAYFDEQALKWKAGCVLKPADVYEPPSQLEAEPSVDMGKLLRHLDLRSPKIPLHLPIKIWKPLPRRYSGPARTITLGDKTLTISQWAHETGLTTSTINGRLMRGWPPDRILSEPCHDECLHSIAAQGLGQSGDPDSA